MLIRALNADDEKQWRPLWRGYLDFYNEALPDEATADLWRRLMEGDPQFGLAASDGDDLVGITHCVVHPTSWSLGPYCYLEDLFVAPRARGRGVGRALIEAVYKAADERGCARVYWHTHKDNAQARILYDKVASLSDFVQYRR